MINNEIFIIFFILWNYILFFYQTALYIASKNGSTDIVEFLLSFSTIDINIPNFKGVTPLMIASYGDNEDVVRFLCQDERINFDMVDIFLNFLNDDIYIFFIFIKTLL